MLLAACSGPVSKTIHDVPENNLELRQVRYAGVEQYVSHPVRWGGKIVSVQSHSQGLLFEIKQLPLTGYGFPLQNISSQGHFKVVLAEQSDIEQYKEGLLVTFTGTIEKQEDNLPVLNGESVFLWPHKVINGKGYSYTGAESKFRGYGIQGSGHYKVY